MKKYGLNNLTVEQLKELKMALYSTVSIIFWVSKSPLFLVIKICFKNGNKEKRIVDGDGITKIGDAPNDFETFTRNDVTIEDVDKLITELERIENQPVIEFYENEEDDEMEDKE